MGGACSLTTLSTHLPSKPHPQVLDRTERLAGATVRMAFDTNKLLGGHSGYPHDHRRGGGGGGHRGGQGGGDRRAGGFSN